MGKHKKKAVKKSKQESPRKKINSPRLSLGGAISLLVSVILGSIILGVLSRLPSLQPLRDSIWYQITKRIIYTAMGIFATFFVSRKPTLTGKILSIAVLSLFWLSYIVPSDQIFATIQTVVYLTLLGHVLFVLCKSENPAVVLKGEALLFGLWWLIDSMSFTYINRPLGLHFWQISLVIGVFATVGCLILMSRDVFNLGKGDAIALPFLAFFLFFMLTMTSAQTLNYALETNSPVEHTAVIEEKDIDTGVRTPVKYIFTIAIDGKSVELNVPQSDYYAYEIGDEYIIECRQGAFGDPFYIYGNN